MEETVRFHVVQTRIEDDLVIIYGVDENGLPRTVFVRFNPSCYFRACHGTTLDKVKTALKCHDGYMEGKSHVVIARRFTSYQDPGDYYMATFTTERALKNAAKCMESDGYEAFQSDLDPIIRFYATLNFDTHGVIEVNYKDYINYGTNPAKPLQTRMLKQLSLSAIPNASTVAYYDLETYSYDDSFPDPQIKENVIYMICVIFKRLNTTTPYLIRIYALGFYTEDAGKRLEDRARQDAPDAKIEFKTYKTERDLLVAFFNETGRQSPSYLVAHNGFGFDIPYLYKRAVGWYDGTVNIPGHAKAHPRDVIPIDALGRAPPFNGFRKQPRLENKKSKTKAHGDIELSYFELRGVEHVDTLLYLRKYHSSMEQFSLDYAAEKHLKIRKDDMSANAMFRAYRTSDAEEMTRAMLYCYQDVNILVQLDNKLAIITTLPVYGSVFCVPSSFILLRGQTVRVTAQMMRSGNARTEDMIVIESRVRSDEDFDDMLTDEKYEGATVLDAKPGFYEDIVATLDFASLYPSIQMAYFICPTLFLTKEDAPAAGIYEEYRVEIKTVDTKTEKVIEVDERDACLLVKNKNGKRVAALMPDVLFALKNLRKIVNKEKKEAILEGNIPLAAALEAKQLAIKTSMNSMYGFLGATSNHLMRKELAALVTQKGRAGLKRVQEFLVEKYSAQTEVLYGDTDSVMIRLLDVNSKEEGAMQRAFTIGKKYAKEASDLLSYERAQQLVDLLGVSEQEARSMFIALCLEFEKCYWPYLLISKKMYAAGKYEDPFPDKLSKVETKGIQMARKTSALVVRNLSKVIMDDLMKRQNRALALQNTFENARVILEDPVTDVTLWEISMKLNSSYKVSATILPEKKSADKIKVEIHFDGKWRCVKKESWIHILGAEPENTTAWLPATNEAYKDWFLLDEAGKKVGRVTITAPQVHVARDLEEVAKGNGPRPGDRVRYIMMEEAHPKAHGGVLTNQAAYAHSVPKTTELLAEGKRVQHSKFFETYMSGVSAFMNVIDPTIGTKLQAMGSLAMRTQAAKAREYTAFGMRDQSGGRAVTDYFNVQTSCAAEKRKNKWAPLPPKSKKKIIEEPNEKDKNSLVHLWGKKV